MSEPLTPEEEAASPEPECVCEGEFPRHCGPECECWHHAAASPGDSLRVVLDEMDRLARLANGQSPENVLLGSHAARWAKALRAALDREAGR